MKVAIIQKYKDKTISQLLNTARRYFNKYILQRDSRDGWGFCTSSGRALNVPSENAHAGHFYPAGKFPRLRFNEDNVHLQGKSDNYFNAGNLLQYRKNLMRKIGVKRLLKLELISQDRSIHKWNRFYLIEVIEKYKFKTKNYENN